MIEYNEILDDNSIFHFLKNRKLIPPEDKYNFVIT